ncbi:MAG: DUF116 domain-containing protein [Thermodesulfobacteriota bacterium]
MASYRLLDTGLLTAAQNMALDEILLEEVAAGRSRPTLRFLRFSPPAVLVGRHQDVDREVRVDFCRHQGIDINRRITGGGAIYFQTSALGWEVFGRIGEPPRAGAFEAVQERICSTGAAAITRLGLPARYRPRNDIEVDGRKISGTGGAYFGGGYLFQGTLLVVNEIELFLRSLRVPVEKLKKRELESLQQRVCFLGDLLDPVPPMAEIKAAFIQALSEALCASFTEEGLTAAEEARLDERAGFFGSEPWIYGKPRDIGGVDGYWSLHQTDGGTLRVHLWTEGRGRRISRALITGDFFCHPARFVLDLEAALKGVKAQPEHLARTVEAFYRTHDGGFQDLGPDQVLEALYGAAGRMDLAALGLSPAEANDIFLVNLRPVDLPRLKPAWLLLPYCSKKLDCEYRTVPDCGRCGECGFDDMYTLAERLDLEPFSIQSFEHLMEVLRRLKGPPDRIFVGSCCEAFYAKHQKEMKAGGARGVLVNLDSTTCYDLGKGMEAYVGRFDHQTEMNRGLIEKVLTGFDGR